MQEDVQGSAAGNTQTLHEWVELGSRENNPRISHQIFYSGIRNQRVELSSGTNHLYDTVTVNESYDANTNTLFFSSSGGSVDRTLLRQPQDSLPPSPGAPLDSNEGT